MWYVNGNGGREKCRLRLQVGQKRTFMQFAPRAQKK